MNGKSQMKLHPSIFMSSNLTPETGVLCDLPQSPHTNSRAVHQNETITGSYNILIFHEFYILTPYNEVQKVLLNI